MDMEGKMGNLRKRLISPRDTGAKNESNNKQWNPLRSILNFLLFFILIIIPLCLYDVYKTDGIFSRPFVDFALSALLVLLMCAVASKVIGANNENPPKKLKIHGFSVNILLMLLNLILVPLRLHQVYLTDGIFSYRFAHFALCAFSLVSLHLTMSGMISPGTCMVLIIPGFISYVASREWDLAFCVTLAGLFFFFIIIFCVVMMCEKSDGTANEKKSDGKGISQSV